MEKMINKQSSIPLYYQVKEIIKGKIKKGEWENNQKIPNELELAKSFDVSRSTVRQAILELVSDDMLVRRKGLGTFVQEIKYEGNFITFSYPEELGTKHIPIETNIIDGPSDCTEQLKLNEDEKAHEIIRIRYFKDEPAVFEKTYLPFAFFPDLLERNLEEPIYNIIVNDYKTEIAQRKSYIEPVILNKEEAEFLGVKPGQPALEITKVCETAEGIPILLSKSIFRKDRCKLLFKFDE